MYAILEVGTILEVELSEDQETFNFNTLLICDVAHVFTNAFQAKLTQNCCSDYEYEPIFLCLWRLSEWYDGARLLNPAGVPGFH